VGWLEQSNAGGEELVGAAEAITRSECEPRIATWGAAEFVFAEFKHEQRRVRALDAVAC
jgi:hypothetical protein